MNGLDLMLLVIIGFSVLHGFRTGLIRSLAKLIGLITGLTVAYYGYRALAAYADQQWGLGEAIAASLLEQLPLPFLLGLMGDGNQNWLDSLGEMVLLPELSHWFGLFCLEIISFVLLLVAVSKLATLLLKTFSKATFATSLGLLDRLGGILFGFVRGVLLVMILVLLAQPFGVMGGLGFFAEQNIVSNSVASSNLLYYFTETLDILNLQLVNPLHELTPIQGQLI